MAKLEDIVAGVMLKGIIPDEYVSVVHTKWHGNNVLEVTYKDNTGAPSIELIYRERESSLDIADAGRKWSFTVDGELFRLVSEALRINMAYLFDPLLAVNTSDVEPLPHQITAVYEHMLARQPLRFLLADDPGSGKTIMAGLLIKELFLRGDLQRCMVVCPGNLAEQWQDELDSKFNLPFEILTNDKLESSRTGNWLQENDLVICRLDKLSRDESLQDKLKVTDWDLIVCDEAHKMSASFFGGEVRYTKRHRLGQMLSSLTRHFLLLTATPHNGKEEDFQLFLSLLDGDRFEGRFRDGVHTVDVTDIMRRLVKEQLVRFNGTPLFPERKAYTVQYELSDPEAQLYQAVTNYVRDEFNRADQLKNEGRKRNIGFALTILQRRLASSPEAILQSIRRRRERLKERLREEELLKRGGQVERKPWEEDLLSVEELEDLEDAPDAEVEEAEELIVDKATAAQTIEELKAEIKILIHLEALAKSVLKGGKDTKWEKLSGLLQETKEMFGSDGGRRKLIIFTEHRDTLNYLCSKIGTLFGSSSMVVMIHGGMGRVERKKAEELFKNDKDVQILVATDAAGEGINLQRAHLMINYDLPWNPNRLEQRFGRIHRIGQTEVCHLWNLVAYETREGEVFLRLLSKLERESEDLKGRVFDVLGQVFQGNELRDLLLEAIRYGERPEVRDRLYQIVDEALDTEHLKALLEDKALANNVFDSSKVREVRDLMERARARKLQPHFIRSFFEAAFKHLGGNVQKREQGRYEISYVPASIRNRDRLIGRRQTVLQRYERVCFDLRYSRIPGKPLAELIAPGHPLLASVIDIILERYRSLLKQGSVLVDEADEGDEPRVLMYLEHAIQDGRRDRNGNRRTASRRLQFIEMGRNGNIQGAGYAPFLNYRAMQDKEIPDLETLLDEEWLKLDIDEKATSFAVEHLVPEHYNEVKLQREGLIDKTITAVRERLTQEITYWDHRAEELRLAEQAGKVNAKINSARAQSRADELQRRLQKREEELKQQKQLSPLPPVLFGGSLVIPKGLIRTLKGDVSAQPDTFGLNRDEVEAIAMEAVMKAEQRMGNIAQDVSTENRGWDIESRNSQDGTLRFIEVKGRREDATTITVSKNEILQALNKPESFFLAIVMVGESKTTEPNYVRCPFDQEPGFAESGRNFEISKLLQLSKR